MDPSEVQERRDLVLSWQLHYGMQPRHDSRLTELFANGVCDWPPDVVARELVATDFIYKQTLYGELVEDFLRRVAVRLRERHRMSWTATWTIVRFYAPIALKLLCLERCGLVIPPPGRALEVGTLFQSDTRQEEGGGI